MRVEILLEVETREGKDEMLGVGREEKRSRRNWFPLAIIHGASVTPRVLSRSVCYCHCHVKELETRCEDCV